MFHPAYVSVHWRLGGKVGSEKGLGRAMEHAIQGGN